MHDLTKIKQQAQLCTIYIADNPNGTRGVIHMVGKQAIWCLRTEDGYTWIVQGTRVRESEVRDLLSGGASPRN